ncbi:hypothetical protein [Smaragdicoccus niigatensis]|uniref:hypothetical protein n=1 Tax=Smaragdicoccus niigatensis TaxID=359359 RepID=UPI0003683AC8|nr:hypothetical protein [Smaragdicoccus niigatensis]
MTASFATSTVADRLDALQALAKTDPKAAQDAAWTWMEDLGQQLPGQAADDELMQLFSLGTPADVDGQTYGMLIGFRAKPEGINRGGEIIYTIAKAFVSTFGVPWLGKKFDQAAMRGTNTMTRLAEVALPILARYRTRKAAGNTCEGFDMLNRFEDSVVAPGTRILVLDYEDASLGNPWPVNQIRDEAVQIVPGTYIGAKIWHQESGYKQIAWWASKLDV